MSCSCVYEGSELVIRANVFLEKIKKKPILCHIYWHSIHIYIPQTTILKPVNFLHGKQTNKLSLFQLTVYLHLTALHSVLGDSFQERRPFSL